MYPCSQISWQGSAQRWEEAGFGWCFLQPGGSENLNEHSCRSEQCKVQLCPCPETGFCHGCPVEFWTKKKSQGTLSSYRPPRLTSCRSQYWVGEHIICKPKKCYDRITILPEQRVQSLTDPWLGHMGKGGPPQSSKITIYERAKQTKKREQVSPRQPHSQALGLH